MLTLSFSLVFSFKTISCSKKFSKPQLPGLLRFNIDLHEAWGLSARADASFKLLHPKGSTKLVELVEDMPVKIALDNLGFYAYGKAKKKERFAKDLMDEFKRDFQSEYILLQNLICAHHDTKLLITYYTKVWYKLGLKKR